MNKEDLFTSLRGLTKEAAHKLCKQNNYDSRVIREDSVDYIVTADFREDRVSLEVVNGLITDFNLG